MKLRTLCGAMACLASASALAQVATLTPKEPGFFRPSNDVSLNVPGSAQQQMQTLQSSQPFLAQPPASFQPPVAAVPVAPAATAAVSQDAIVSPPMNAMAAPVQAPQAQPTINATEQQMDRSVLEHERAKAESYPVRPADPNAFNGSTSERDR